MHPALIKAELTIQFGSVKAFEEAKQLPVDSVRDVLRGRSVRQAADAIAAALDKSIEDLFPGRFAYPERDHKSRKRDAHRLNAVAR